MAAHLQSRGLERGARIAILSKNCAHFFMAELAIWMAGYTTVAIFPTETAETVRFVLEHSEASLLFVGKLDTWDAQKPGVPAGLPCIAFPLAPQTPTTTPGTPSSRAPSRSRAGRSARADELAMLIYTSGSTGAAQGRDGELRRHHRAPAKALPTHPSARSAPETRAAAVLPAAGAQLRALVRRGRVAGRRRPTSTSPSRSTPSCRTCSARGRRSSSRCRGCGSSSSRACSRRCRRKSWIGCSASRSSAGSSAKKVLKGLGLDQVRLAGSGSAPIPAELIAWYRRLGLNLYRRLRHDRGLLVLAHLERRVQRPGYVGVPLPGVRCASATKARS